MTADTAGGRHAKGVGIIGLVKVLRAYRRQQPLDELSPEAKAMLEDRILVSTWYPLPWFLELLEATYRRMMGSKPEHALTMGVTAGKEIWASAHRVFVAERGPLRSLRAMGPAWHNYFDFGQLELDEPDDNTVRFTIHGYPDVPVYHGMTIAGWHLAAAQLSGAPDATAEVTERPWEGAPRQVHVVRF